MKEQEKQIKVSIVKQQFLAESPVDDIKAAQSQVFNIGSGFGHFTFKIFGTSCVDSVLYLILPPFTLNWTGEL